MIAFKLVLCPPPKTPLFQVNVYTMTNQAIPRDSVKSGGKWIDLNVALFEYNHQIPLEERESYQLILEIVGLDENIQESTLSDILNSMTPMLVIYSYDGYLFESLFQVANTEPNRVIKRTVSDPNPPTMAETLQDKQDQFCKVNTVNLTSFNDMGLSSDNIVISEVYPSFNFCYGHCRPAAGNILERTKVSPNSELVERMESGLVPCCVPKRRKIGRLLTSSALNPEVVTMITVENVLECGCY